MNLTPDLLHASGSIYFDGCRDVADFERVHGFNPAKYPQAWRVNANGLVCSTSPYRNALAIYFLQVRANWAALGISA